MHSINTWSRYPSNNKSNYEFSSKGDKRFSPLFAMLPDGRLIEEAYQLDIKGYRKYTNEWREAKGKPPLNDLSKHQMFTKFRRLFVTLLESDPILLTDFIELSKKYENFVDRFASTEINQARALCDIANALRSGKLIIKT